MNCVKVWFLDGKMREWKTNEQLEVKGPLLVIGQGGASHVAINLAQVVMWEVEASKIERAVGMPPGGVRQ